MNAAHSDDPSLADHELAFTETAFLLDIFATTIHELMGDATGTITRIAGRSMGRKLPVHLTSPDLEQVILAVADQLKGGFDIVNVGSQGCSELCVRKCAIRRICEARHQPLDGSLCKLFHFYLDGIVNELYCRPVKSHIATTGNQCTIRMTTK
jgi:hypothetical protein